MAEDEDDDDEMPVILRGLGTSKTRETDMVCNLLLHHDESKFEIKLEFSIHDIFGGENLTIYLVG